MKCRAWNSLQVDHDFIWSNSHEWRHKPIEVYILCTWHTSWYMNTQASTWSTSLVWTYMAPAYVRTCMISHKAGDAMWEIADIVDLVWPYLIHVSTLQDSCSFVDVAIADCGRQLGRVFAFTATHQACWNNEVHGSQELMSYKDRTVSWCIFWCGYIDSNLLCIHQ